MKRIAGLFAGCVLVAAMAAMAADAGPEVTTFAWLEGSWGSVQNGVETEEQWTSAAGGAMVGMNKAVRAEKLVSFEFLRIARIHDGADAGKLAYFAQPGGAPPTAFPLKQAGERSFTFESAGHDFPQRISYRLEADGTLVARIEGTIDGKEQAMEWRWRKR